MCWYTIMNVLINNLKQNTRQPSPGDNYYVYNSVHGCTGIRSTHYIFWVEVLSFIHCDIMLISSNKLGGK